MEQKHKRFFITASVWILSVGVLTLSNCNKGCGGCNFVTCPKDYSKRYWLYDVKDDPGSAAMWVDLDFLDNDYISASTQNGTKKVQLYSSDDSVRAYRVSDEPFAVHIYINVLNMEVVYSWSEKGPGVFDPTVYTKDYFGVLSCEK